MNPAIMKKSNEIIWPDQVNQVLNQNLKNIPPLMIIVAVFMILLILLTNDSLVLALIGGLIGYFVGRRVDTINREERQEEVAKLIVNRVEKQWENLIIVQKKLGDFLTKSWWELTPEMKAKTLNESLAKLQKDGVYQAAIYQIGVFPVELINCVSNYDLSLGLLSDLMRQGIMTPRELEDRQTLEFLLKQLHATQINGALCLMTLKKKFFQKFPVDERYQSYLRTEYQRGKNHHQNGKVSVYEENGHSHNIETMFEFLGISEDLKKVTI